MSDGKPSVTYTGNIREDGSELLSTHFTPDPEREPHNEILAEYDRYRIKFYEAPKAIAVDAITYASVHLDKSTLPDLIVLDTAETTVRAVPSDRFVDTIMMEQIHGLGVKH